MSLLQTLIFALVQGITELFPISSVGHGVLIPFLFHWPAIQSSPVFLPYLVMLHVGTAIALLIFFFVDWLVFLRAVFVPSKGASKHEGRLARKEFFLIVVATIPAVILGGLFTHKFETLFANPRIAMIFLIVNGVILLYGDRLLKRGGRKEPHDLSYGQALIVGILQSFALIPGFSRSGMSMIGGLMYGLRYEAAARFSFLLATPLILGAAVKELPKLHHAPHGMLTMALVGGLVAGVAALFSTWFLMRYFKTKEVKALRPFGIYCLIVGAGSLILSFFI